jgi:hypothetical protein
LFRACKGRTWLAQARYHDARDQGLDQGALDGAGSSAMGMRPARAARTNASWSRSI